MMKMKSKHTSLKIYKLSKTDIFFSLFEGTRGEKNNKYFAPKTPAD